MDWPIVMLILGGIAIVGVLILGGTFAFRGLKIDTPGFLHWLAKAREQKETVTLAHPVKHRPSLRSAKLPSAVVAWVDDNPLNNQFERLAFASAGIYCDSYTTNREAKEALSRATYDLVISDLGRNNSSETGWDLIPEVKRRNIPFVLYTMNITDALRSKSTLEGVAAITASPDELAQSVFALLAKRN